MIDISEGRTGNYFVYGVGVILTSFILTGIGLSGNGLLLCLSVPLFILSIVMFLATNGLEIANGNYRKYSRIGGVKIGKWYSFVSPESVLLRMHAENISRKFGVGMITYLPSQSTKVISYDIVLTDELQKKTTIYEFIDYKLAKKTLQLISETYEIPRENKVAEKLMENKLKRRSRRR